MGRGQANHSRPVVGMSSESTELPQWHFDLWSGPPNCSPSYTIRARQYGRAHLLVSHIVDRLWASAGDGKFIHTPFEPVCACNEANCVPVHAWNLALQGGFTLPKAASFTPYRYRSAVAGVVVATSGLPNEIPLFVIRLDDDFQVVSGARLRDVVIVDGVCSKCRHATCAHTEAAQHATSKGADFERMSDAALAGMPGVMSYGRVKGYPPELGNVAVCVMDYATQSEAIAMAKEAREIMLKEMDKAVREQLLDQLKAEKKAKGETFDATQFKTQADEKQERKKTAWDMVEDPDSGFAFEIEGPGGTIWRQPMRSATSCACEAAPGCAHEKLLDRIGQSPEIVEAPKTPGNPGLAID